MEPSEPPVSQSWRSLAASVCLWFMMGIASGYGVLGRMGEAVGERYTLSSLIESLPRILGFHWTYLLPAALLALGTLCRARIEDRPRLFWCAVPLPLALAAAICFRTFLPEGTFRNLSIAYSFVIGGSLTVAMVLAPFLTRVRLPDRVPLLVTAAFVILYAILWSRWTLHRHFVFRSAAWDLGYIESALWNTTQGRLFETSLCGENPAKCILGEHFFAILIPLLPIYWLGGASPQALLTIQSVWLATGAFPLFLAMRLRWKDPFAATLGAVAYLFFPALHIINCFDFHPLALSIPFVFWAFYYLEKRAWFNYGLFLVLAALCREELSLLVSFWGLYLLIVKKRVRAGILTQGLGILMFVFIIRVWLPHFSGREGFWPLIRYDDLGDNFGEVLHTLVTNPLRVIRIVFQVPKMEMVLRLCVPLLFLCFLSPSGIFFFLPPMALCLLSSADATYSFATHHITGPVFGAWTTFVLGLSRPPGVFYREEGERTIRRTLVFGVLLASAWTARMQWENSVWNRLDDLRRPVTPRILEGHRLMERVPEGTVSTQYHILPHLSHRRECIYTFPLGLEGADHVILDLSRHEGSGFLTYPLRQDEFRKTVQGLLQSGQFGKEVYSHGWLWMRRGSPNLDFSDVERDIR